MFWVLLHNLLNKKNISLFFWTCQKIATSGALKESFHKIFFFKFRLYLFIGPLKLWDSFLPKHCTEIVYYKEKNNNHLFCTTSHHHFEILMTVILMKAIKRILKTLENVGSKELSLSIESVLFSSQNGEELLRKNKFFAFSNN